MTFADEGGQRRPLLLRLARGDEDLVHDTVVAAISHKDSFMPGSNLTGWLVTILKNRRSTLGKKYRRETTPVYDPRFVHPVGTARLEAREALVAVPEELLLTKVIGHSYKE